MIDKSKTLEFYQTDMFKVFLERMKENIVKEYPADYRRNDPISKRDQQTIVEFKKLMERMIGSPHKIELQLTILEDITMNFLTPYTRQLLLERINKRCQVCGNLSEEGWIFCMTCGSEFSLIKSPDMSWTYDEDKYFSTTIDDQIEREYLLIEEEHVKLAGMPQFIQNKVLKYAQQNNVSIKEAMAKLGFEKKGSYD